jgi:hypothetical protein
VKAAALVPRWVLALAVIVHTAAALSANAGCGREQALTLRAGDGSSIRALLSAGAAPGLRVTEAGTHRLIWSFGEGSAFNQPVKGMSAALFGSFMAIDLDGDGMQDRIYAGDSFARIWRIDLHRGHEAAFPADVILFADFSDSIPAGGFISAPDVALIAPRGEQPWISIAIGSATLRAGVGGNRFYVLRDGLAAPVGHETSGREPVRESSLEQVHDLPANVRESQPYQSGAGFFLVLGTGQILAPSVTLDGRVFLSVAETTGFGISDCSTLIETAMTQVSVTALNVMDASIAADLNQDGIRDHRDIRVALPVALPPATALTLRPDIDQSRLWRCHAGDQSIPDCQVDLGPQRIWWRREDAD